MLVEAADCSSLDETFPPRLFDRVCELEKPFRDEVQRLDVHVEKKKASRRRLLCVIGDGVEV